MRGASIEVFQIGSGMLRCELSHIDLDKSSVHYNELSISSRGIGDMPSGRGGIVITDTNPDGHFNGRVLAGNAMLYYPPGSEFCGTTTGVYRDWNITFDVEEWARSCAALGVPDAEPLCAQRRLLKPDDATLDSLRVFVQSLEQNLRQNHAAINMPATRHSLHKHLIDLLSQATVSALQEPFYGARSGVSQSITVRRAEEFLQANSHEPVTLNDLCAAMNVSERTLRYAFGSVMGISPIAYLRVLRLNRVRRAIQNPLQVPEKVYEVAFQNGFTHLGRFSRDYKLLFGELPSVTLASARNTQSVR